jgi:putative transposase
VKVRYKFRCYPTDRQKRQLAKEFGCARHAYNFALQLRTDSFKAGKPVNYNASSAALTKHRSDPEFAFLRESSSVPQQQALRHLQTAFSNFFAKRTAYPVFRSKHGKQSAEYVGNGFKWDAANRDLSISKVGRLHVKWSRGFTSKPTTVTITKDCAGCYFVSLCLDEPAKAALPKTGSEVGIDLGISRLATLSNGERIANPRHTARYAGQLARLQRVLSRRVKGSGRWKAQKLKVARLHARIANTRKDAMDKITTDLVRRFDVLAVEDLSPRNMVKNRRLAKGLSDASFGQFRQMLTYKCAWYGRELRVADRFFPSSKRCNSCGHIHASLGLDVREFNCENCGTHLDRDENAAINILKFAKVTSPTTAGQAGCKGRGETVRPMLASASSGRTRRSVNQPSSANV